MKTFWWSLEWPGIRGEPEPALTVVGTRLDGPGAFPAGLATNAARDDFREAILVGVQIPTAGCWQITPTFTFSPSALMVSADLLQPALAQGAGRQFGARRGVEALEQPPQVRLYRA